jgi:uncharacterized membrane protein
MEAALVAVTNYVALAIDFIALLVIAFGSVEAFVAVVRGLAAPGPVAGEERRAVWLRYARWLVAGLTFQLAADIVGTAIAPTWDEIGRLGAIAVIRTFLNYFLERDIGQVRERQVTRLDSAKETS